MYLRLIPSALSTFDRVPRLFASPSRSAHEEVRNSPFMTATMCIRTAFRDLPQYSVVPLHPVRICLVESNYRAYIDYTISAQPECMASIHPGAQDGLKPQYCLERCSGGFLPSNALQMGPSTSKAGTLPRNKRTGTTHYDTIHPAIDCPCNTRRLSHLSFPADAIYLIDRCC